MSKNESKPSGGAPARHRCLPTPFFGSIATAPAQVGKAAMRPRELVSHAAA
jgi:hypothetical protein